MRPQTLMRRTLIVTYIISYNADKMIHVSSLLKKLFHLVYNGHFRDPESV